MKSGLKKRSIIGIIAGLLFTVIPGILVFNQYQIVSTGQEVVAVVSDIITVQTDDGTSYKPEFTYTYNGVQQTYLPNYTASRSLLPNVGDEKKLSVSDRGVVVRSIGIGLLGPLIGLLIGLLVLVISILSMIKGIKRSGNIATLKRFGRKINVRFVRKDTTSYRVNNQHGSILFFQEEGNDRVYQTHPIFSEFSVKWLEEHIFDVYIDTANPDNYYVDMEKHFGEPVKHSLKNTLM